MVFLYVLTLSKVEYAVYAWEVLVLSSFPRFLCQWQNTNMLHLIIPSQQQTGSHFLLVL